MIFASFVVVVSSRKEAGGRREGQGLEQGQLSLVEEYNTCGLREAKVYRCFCTTSSTPVMSPPTVAGCTVPHFRHHGRHGYRSPLPLATVELELTSPTHEVRTANILRSRVRWRIRSTCTYFVHRLRTAYWWFSCSFCATACSVSQYAFKRATAQVSHLAETQKKSITRTTTYLEDCAFVICSHNDI